MSRRRVLLVGAHLDGRWIDAEDTELSRRVSEPMPLDFKRLPPAAAGAGIPMPDYVDYRFEPMPIAIRSAQASFWIGVASTLRGSERDLAIVRAIFQRDVAQQFEESS